MSGKLYQFGMFEAEEMAPDQAVECIVQVNSCDSRQAASPLSLVIQTNTEDLMYLFLYDGVRNRRHAIPVQEICNHPPIPHTHNYYEMTVVLQGEVDIRIENEVRHYKKGDVCLLNRNTHHTEHMHPGVTLAFLCFSPKMMAEYSGYSFSFLYPAGEPDFVRFFESDQENKLDPSKSFLEFRKCKEAQPPAAEAVLEQIRQELLQHRPGYVHILYGLLMRMHYLLADQSLYQCQYTEVPLLPDLDLVDRIQQYVEGRRRRFSRQEIEEALHYNRDYLNRIFRQYTGVTLGDYCRSICMEEAAHRLLHTDDTIEKIAEQVGFPNRTQFYRIFQQYYHTTPSAYRKAKRRQVQQVASKPDFLQQS